MFSQAQPPIRRKVEHMKAAIKAIGLGIAVSALLSVSSPGRTIAGQDEPRDRALPHLSSDHRAGQPQPSLPLERPANLVIARVAMNPVADPAYKEQCGACHFAYQPDLLPSGSWRKILGKLDDHFGEVLSLSPEMVDEIGRYLEANAAERSSAKRAVKIVDSLGGATPLRVTEVPYILRKHKGVSADVLRRPSIKSLANCIACHRTASNGVYDDDSVSIPK
jgi:hypothetical protein